MKIIECEQGSDEWHTRRMGLVTASKISDVMAKGKGITRTKYRAELVSQRLTGVRREGFKSEAMERGNELEPMAREFYAFKFDTPVITTTPSGGPIGLVLHPAIEGAACSPDGLVGGDGLVQFKCPEAHTHLDTLEGGSIDGAYLKQMQFEMACTGRQWNDFVSYCEAFGPEHCLHVTRVKRDPLLIAEIEREVRLFLSEVDEMVARYVAKEAAQ